GRPTRAVMKDELQSRMKPYGARRAPVTCSSARSCAILRVRTPDGLEAAFPAAGGAVELVPNGVLLVVVLVVFLRGPELRRGRDLGHDRLLQALRDRVFGCLRQLPLRRIV